MRIVNEITNMAAYIIYCKKQPMINHHRLIIIWSGPAGHCAAIYAARAALKPLMFEWWLAWGVAAGGQLTTTTVVENYPWFADGIDGPKLMDEMRAQSINSGTQILTQTVDQVDLSVRPFKLYAQDIEYTADSIIISTGATAKRLDIPWADTYWMAGISGCAICDGALPMFRNKVIAVIGGGDVAVEEAVHMSHFGSKVYVLVRSDSMRASAAMQAKLTSNDKIEVMRHTEALEVLGNWSVVTGLKIINNITQDETELEIAGLFFAIGHTPNTWFLDGQVLTDETWYIATVGNYISEELHGSGKYQTQTSVEWVFAAWDVADKVYRQAVTSAGTWCMAALEVEKWLQK